MAKQRVKRPTRTSPNERAGTPNRAAPSPTLGKPEIKKIQRLLKSKTADGVTLGLSLLESLGTTRADYEAVFKEAVIKSILSGWVGGGVVGHGRQGARATRGGVGLVSETRR